MPDVHVVILAAGKGTRMKSVRPKVLHRVAGTPMIDYVLATAAQLAPRSVTVVVGHQADVLRAALSGHSRIKFVVQEPQLGTGHALLSTRDTLSGARGSLVLLSGDVPSLSVKSLKALVNHHVATQAAATVMTAVVGNPGGYGRIVRTAGSGGGHQIARIVEEKDATATERDIQEINS